MVTGGSFEKGVKGHRERASSTIATFTFSTANKFHVKYQVKTYLMAGNVS